jgi:outer membrane biosynthesis protein TonB
MTNAACRAVLISLGTILPVLASADDSNVAQIRFSENVEAKRVELEIRLSDPENKVEVKASANGETLPVQYTPFGGNDDDNAAILFLIDKSDPKRGKTIEAAKALVLRLVKQADQRTRCAVYAFDANLALVSDFGATPTEVTAGLKKVKAVGMATELYRSALDAITLLEKMPVKRRGVMLLSDGKAEDTTYTLEQAIVAAKKAAVTMYGVGYAESPQSTIYLQSLRRLASETGGLFAEADRRTRSVPEEFENTVFPLLQSGGTAWVDLSANKTAKQIEVTVQTEGHEPHRQTFALSKLAPPEPTPTPAPTPDDTKVTEVEGKVEAMAKKMEEVAKQVAAVPTKVEEVAKKSDEARKAEAAAQAEEASKQAHLAAAKAKAADELRASKEKRTRIILAILGGLAIALLLGFFLYQRRQRALAAAAAANAPVFARLQVLDGDGTEYPMRTTALRVGRGKDNDLALKNDSVSRHHAEIHRTRDGIFTITELKAGNGVLVNGTPVEKATLKSEDVIELGEVRIRFLVDGQKE